MKLTYLGCGKDPTNESDLACHLLDINQSCVLLECPLDLSALTLFLPAPSSTQSILQSSARQEVTLHGSVGRKRKGNRDVHRDVLLRPSASTKRVRLSNEECDGGLENGRDKGGEHKGVSSLFREIHGQVLANGEPWYKVAGLELVDVGLLDAVIISNPSGMLGLPFLTKHPDFCGKIYATKATAEIGRMMMEELVLMHADFIQDHGHLKTGQKPPCLDPSILCTLPEHMRGSALGRCFSNRADWQPLYSAQDIRDCFVHVKKLRYGEEFNVNGSLRVSPSSSGMGIGASNWVLSGARQTVGYVAASSATKNHAMPLDKAPLAGCHALIISDVEFSSEAVVMEKAISSREDLVVKAQEIPDCGVSGIEYGGPLRQSSLGSGSSQRPTRRASGSFSSVVLARGSSAGVAKSGTVGLSIGTGVIEKAGKSGNGDLDGPLRGVVTTSNSVPEVASACRGAIEAIRRGGSVLFPLSPSGLLLELLDELGVQLAAANLKHIPIHYISTAAEEMLAYCNTVPEWLCTTRQEKLYAGESLFGYVDLVQEKRLRHSKAFSSPELQKVWQEPCVVFAAHFSLRMGPAAHLLNRWRQNPLCLLVLTEGESDKDLLLAPYMPLLMQVLELRASLRLRSKEVVSLLQTLQPQVALQVPDFLQKSLEGDKSLNTKVILGYKKGRSPRVPNFETELVVDMSAELALQVQPKLVKSYKVAAAPFQADFCFRDGKLSLQTPIASGLSSDVGVRSRDYQYRWGQVNVGALSRALQERGIGDVSFRDPVVDESSSGREGHANERKSLVVEIRSPSRAWIELGPSSSHIKANEPSLRHLIADAVNSVLQVM